MSAPLQRAYVEILPEMRQFGTQLRTQVRESVSTSTRELGRLNAGVTESVSHVEQAHAGLFKGMRSQIKELASFALPTLGAIEGFKFIKESIAASREEGKQLRQTAAVIKSTGGAAHVTANDVKELAKQQSIHTGITATQIRANENLLLTFTGVRNEVGKGNDIFSQATKTVLDMSVALKEDGKAASIQLGKALNDPIKGITALRRVGVSFTDQQKEQIKTMVASGNTIGAQKVILHELTKEFGGSAAAQADASDKMKAGFEAFRVELGNRLVPLIDKAETFITSHLLPAVTGFFEELGKGTGPIGAIKDALGAMIGILANVVRQVFNVLVITFRALRPLIIEVAHFISNDLYPALRAVTNILAGALGSALKAFGGFIQRHTTLVKTLAVMIGTAVLAWKAWTTAIKIWTFITKIATAVQVAFDAAMDANPIMLVIIALVALTAGMIYAYKHSKTFRDIMADIGSVFAWVWHHVLEPVVDFFRNNWKAALEIAIGVISPFLLVPIEIVKHWGAITTWFGNLFHAVTGALRSTGSWLLGAGRGILNGLWTGIKFVWDHFIWPLFIAIPGRIIRIFASALGWLINAGRSILRGLWTGIKFVWDNLIYPLFIGIPRRVIGFFGNAIGWLINAGRRILSGLLSGIRNGWDSISSWLGGIAGRVLHFFGNAIGWLWHAGVKVFTGLLHGIQAGFKSIVNWFLDLPGHILHALGINSPPKWAIDAGHWIVKGLHKGLTSLFGLKKFFGPVLDDFVNGMINDVLSLGGALNVSGDPHIKAEQNYARQHFDLYHWGIEQLKPLIGLWNGESGWNPNALNSKSGAYGIPQALPASKMSSAGSDWRTNPGTQIDWGLKYIHDRYGTPGNAYSQWLARSPHWYEKGSWRIAETGIAGLHKNEMVLPARIADAVRSALRPGSSSSTAAGSAGGVAIAQLDEMALARAIVAALAGARLQFDEHGLAQIVTRHQTINAIRGAHR